MNTKQESDTLSISSTTSTVKFEPIEESEISDGDGNNCYNMVDLPFKVELKEEESIGTNNDETSARVKIEPSEECDCLDENEYPYNNVSSSLKVEIVDDPETLEVAESCSNNGEYSVEKEDMGFANICKNLEIMEYIVDCEPGITTRCSDIAPHFPERHYENQLQDGGGVNFEKDIAGTSVDRNFGCPQCEKQLHDKSALMEHLKHHSGKRPFSCLECEETFTRKYSLNQHIMTHRGIPLPCKICNKFFKNKYSHSRHMRTHRKEKNYGCEQCGKKFLEKCILEKHERIHRGEKPYSCQECNKSFLEKGTLTRHERIHRGERPYKCENCGKKFTCIKTLEYHVNTHTGVKPYECFTCGKSFHGNSGLNAHLKTHEKEKVFVCEHCNTLFATARYLRKHIQRKHPSDPLSNKDFPESKLV